MQSCPLKKSRSRRIFVIIITFHSSMIYVLETSNDETKGKLQMAMGLIRTLTVGSSFLPFSPSLDPEK